MVFLGGAVLADVMKSQDNFWITKKDFDEKDNASPAGSDPLETKDNQDLPPADLPQGWETIDGEFSLIASPSSLTLEAIPVSALILVSATDTWTSSLSKPASRDSK